MKSRKMLITVLCFISAVIICLSAFVVPVSASASQFIPSCANYPLKSALPYGDQTIVLFFETSNYYYWFFSRFNTKNEINHNYIVDKGSYCRVFIWSASPVIECRQTKATGTLIESEVGIFTSGLGAFTYADNFIGLFNAQSNFVCLYYGNDAYFSSLEGQLDLNAGESLLYWLCYDYPDDVYEAVESLNDQISMLQGSADVLIDQNTALQQTVNNLSNVVDGLSDQNNDLLNSVDNLSSQNYQLLSEVESLEDHISSLSDDVAYLESLVNAGNGEMQSQINDSAEQITNHAAEQASKAASEVIDSINNAGADADALDTDLSWMESALAAVNGWVDSVNGFADSLDFAADDVVGYIETGADFVSGFLGVAPTCVIILLSFGLVFMVVRKLIGR